jgi:hypothetical protein
MKNKICISILVIFSFGKSFSQEFSVDDLLSEIPQPQQVSLLPEKMLFSQRLLWGEKGLYRRVGIAPKQLTPETREMELKVRRTFFRIHQITGFLAAGGMLAQGIIGSRLYKGDFQAQNLHRYVALATNIEYGTTALMAFTAPPPMINRKKFDNIKLHKALAVVHLSGMVATNVLGNQASEGNVNKQWHRAAALTTFGAYTAAIVSVKLEF